MSMERCEGCPLVNSHQKCKALLNLLKEAQTAFNTSPIPPNRSSELSTNIIPPKQAVSYEVECSLLLSYHKRTGSMRKSRGPLDDMREVSFDEKCGEKSRIKIEVEGEIIDNAYVLDWRLHVLNGLARQLG